MAVGATQVQTLDPHAPELWGGLEPRRWQGEALPLVIQALRERKRAVVSAIMGAGKTRFSAALVGMAAQKSGDRTIIVAVPTQALVEQTASTFREVLGEHRVGRYYANAKEPKRPIVICCYPSLLPLHADLVELGKRVSFLLVDELHKSEADTIKAIIPAIAPTSMAGLTATPYRSIPSESLSMWDEVVYRYTLADALKDGVLVPMRRVTWDGEGSSLVDDVVLEMVKQHGHGPGIVSARDISDAVAYADFLSAGGVPAAAIHSRLRRQERVRLLEMLQAGELRCLVHVSLLAEGVDMPWLRWLALRRPVQARVRFLQELGRVLRVTPGKTEGVVLDPHDLLGLHGLTHAEAIGDALEEAADKETREANEPQLSEEEEREMHAVALNHLVKYIRILRVELETHGILEPALVTGYAWRLRQASERQVATLTKLSRLTRHVPRQHRETLKVLVKHPHALTSGQCSDLIDILIGGANWCRSEAKRQGLEPWFVQWPYVGVDVGIPDHTEVKAFLKARTRG
ncbi:MAG: DEAD/DEAH box helicase family protein [Proteobacteria bacterium]|nr:DEAD/DEAH box helicase family protein [Pseudomonadota bacterium]